jgi:hypothetical protein
MNDETKTNVKNPETWKRVLYIVLFAIIFNVAEFVLAVIVVFQFFMTLFTGAPHARARDFGGQLGVYLEQVVRFLTYNSDEAPFPFADWPPGPAPAAPDAD